MTNKNNRERKKIGNSRLDEFDKKTPLIYKDKYKFIFGKCGKKLL